MLGGDLAGTNMQGFDMVGEFCATRCARPKYYLAIWFTMVIEVEE